MNRSLQAELKAHRRPFSFVGCVAATASRFSKLAPYLTSCGFSSGVGEC